MKQKIRLNKAGFSMVELFATVLVIAVLAGLILGVAGAANKKAAVAKAQSELNLIAMRIEEWKAVKGVYPQTSGTLDLSNVSANTDMVQFYASDLNKEIEDMTTDPWGKGYRYEGEVRKFKLWSMGPDGKDSSSAEQLDDVRL